MTSKQKVWTRRREQAKEMRAKGYTLQAIGDVLGITRERVRQIIDKDYLSTRKKLYTGRYK